MSETSSRRERFWDVAVCLLLFAVYSLTLPIYLPDADGPEFTVVGLVGGIAHPPGYPLYCLMLRVISWFASTPEMGFKYFALFSCLLTTGAAWILLDLLRRIEISGVSRRFAVGVAFTGAAIWQSANNTEPFALNFMLCACVFWLSAAFKYHPALFGLSRRKLVFAMGLCFGLGFCNHHTQVLLLPMALIAMFSSERQRADLASEFGWISAGFLIGLLPIAYFYTTDLNAPLAWGHDAWRSDPFGRLVTHMFRREYGTWSLTKKSRTEMAPLFFFNLVLESLVYIGVVFFGAGVVRTFQNRSDSVLQSVRSLKIMIPSALLTLAFMFNLRSNGSAYDRSLLTRFVGLPIICLVPFIALGFESLCSRLRPQFKSTICAVLIFGNLFINLPAADRKHQALAEHHLKTMLSIVNHGYFMHVSDVAWCGIPFLQVVRGFAPQVQSFSLGDVIKDEARKSTFERLGVISTSDNPLKDLANSLAAKAPFFSEWFPSGTEIENQAYPIGPVNRIVAAGMKMPSALDVFAMNTELYKKLLESPLLSKETAITGYEKTILANYAFPWTALEPQLRKDFPQLADECKKYRSLFLFDLEVSQTVLPQ